MSLPSDTGAYLLPTAPQDAGWVRALWPGAVIGAEVTAGSSDGAVALLLQNAHTLWTHHNGAIMVSCQACDADADEVALYQIDNSGGGGASAWEVALECEVQPVDGRTAVSFQIDYENGGARARVYDSGGAVGAYVTLPTSSGARAQDSDLLDLSGADPDTAYIAVELQASAGQVAALWSVTAREQWP